jgi:hypothetical protein
MRKIQTYTKQKHFKRLKNSSTDQIHTKLTNLLEITCDNDGKEKNINLNKLQHTSLCEKEVCEGQRRDVKKYHFHKA